MKKKNVNKFQKHPKNQYLTLTQVTVPFVIVHMMRMMKSGCSVRSVVSGLTKTVQGMLIGQKKICHQKFLYVNTIEI